MSEDFEDELQQHLTHEELQKLARQYELENESLVDELLAPVRREFAESGMSEDDLDVFMNSVREKTYQDRQSK